MKIVSGDTEMDQFQQRFFIIVTTMTVLAIAVSWIAVALTFVADVVGPALGETDGNLYTKNTNPKN